MAEPRLEAQPLLGGYDRSFGALRLTERADAALVSLAVPQGESDVCTAAVQRAWGTDLPEPGQSVVSRDGSTRLISSTADQYLALFSHAGPNAVSHATDVLGHSFYMTDQSDVWVMLDLSGPGVQRVLERLCPVDLHDDVFPVNASARTVMEHMGALVIRTGDTAFSLLSASSSARSFLHAVETSIHYTSGPWPSA